MLSVMAPAIADTDYDNPLTVTGLKTGDTIKFYKVIEWVGEAEGNVAGWKAISPYDTVLTPEVLRTVIVGTPAQPAQGTEGEDGYESIPLFSRRIFGMPVQMLAFLYSTWPP